MQFLQPLIDVLRQNPELALFLTLAIGFSLASFRLFKPLGTVTITLIAGLLIGQLDIHVAPVVQNTFFMMFLFAVGYSVGPQFFPALKKEGLPQVAFGLILCFAGFATAYIAGKIMGYDPALTAGLLAGGYTNTGTLGVASANMHVLGLGPQHTASMASLAAVAYAVTYPFGTAGAAWFLGSLAPKILRVDLPAAAKELEKKLGSHSSNEELANPPLEARAFRLSNEQLAGHTPRELNRTLGESFYITRYRGGGKMVEANVEAPIPRGATVAIAGSPQALLLAEQKVGPEVDDPDLLAYEAEKIEIVVTKKDAMNRTLGDLQRDEIERYGRPIFLIGLTRAGKAINSTPDTKIQRWDVLTVRGVRAHVEDLVRVLGSADRATSKSDIAYMGAGIVIGGLIGAITIHVAGIPLGLSTSVGTLLAGLVCGYLRSLYRTFGRIPQPALWVFNNVGLNGMVAVIGLNAASGLVSGLTTYGIGLFVAGIFVSLVPLIVGLLVGKYVFKFHPVLLLGACAGARTTTAALGAVQDAAQSPLPAVGYTVPYAVARIVLAIFGLAMLLVMN